jgi:hypothetical protein
MITYTSLDPGTFKVVDRFRVGVDPQHVVPSYDLKTLRVTNNAEGRTDGESHADRSDDRQAGRRRSGR